MLLLYGLESHDAPGSGQHQQDPSRVTHLPAAAAAGHHPYLPDIKAMR